MVALAARRTSSIEGTALATIPAVTFWVHVVRTFVQMKYFVLY